VFDFGAPSLTPSPPLHPSPSPMRPSSSSSYKNSAVESSVSELENLMRERASISRGGGGGGGF
jgi:hypothetical protein